MTWGNDDAFEMFSDLGRGVNEETVALRVMNNYERTGRRVPVSLLKSWAMDSRKRGRNVMATTFERWSSLYSIVEELDEVLKERTT